MAKFVIAMKCIELSDCVKTPKTSSDVGYVNDSGAVHVNDGSTGYGNGGWAIGS